MESVKSNRLSVLYALSENLNVPYSGLEESEKLIENTPSKVLPTIGAEIEVPWKSLIPEHENWFNEKYSEFSEEKRKKFSKLCSKIDGQIRPLYETAKKAGVGEDRITTQNIYHEFSHKPANWYKTLSDEIGILFDKDLIHEGYVHPMHVTLGGVSHDKETGIATSLVEILGGSETQRIISPSQNSRLWSQRGHCGINSRSRSNIERYPEGVEIRTLMAKHPKQVEKTLRNCQILGASIRAYQKDFKNSFEEELSSTWENIRETTVNEMLRPYHLNKWWQDPLRDKRDWRKFTSLFVADEMKEIKTEIEGKIEGLENLIVDYLVSESKPKA